jgi:F-type H+-transporting ATPase subunit epsilon
MKTIPVDIVTPEKTERAGEFEFVVLPGSEGELGILPGHTHLVAQLKAGRVRMAATGGATQTVEITEGFGTIKPDGVTVITTAVRKV